MANDVESFYYSGQGVVMIAERNTDGTPKAMVPVGNVSDLKISIATTVLEHKESQTGQRAVDKRITTETKATLSITMESFIAANLAIALRGEVTEVVAATETGEPFAPYPGRVNPLLHIKVSAVVIDGGVTALEPFDPLNPDDPWDYIVNEDAGSIRFNDASDAPFFKAGNAGQLVTAITVGATTDFTITAPSVAVGSKVAMAGFAGVDAANVNDQTATVVTNTGTHITVNIDTTADTITLGSGKLFGAGTTNLANADYAYAAQKRIDSLTVGSTERYLRFEGLNTADDFKPVVIEIFKFEVDPLKELALISDGIGQFVLEGNALSDSLQLTGSKYFKTTQLR